MVSAKRQHVQLAASARLMDTHRWRSYIFQAQKTSTAGVAVMSPETAPTATMSGGLHRHRARIADVFVTFRILYKLMDRLFWARAPRSLG